MAVPSEVRDHFCCDGAQERARGQCPQKQLSQLPGAHVTFRGLSLDDRFMRIHANACFVLAVLGACAARAAEQPENSPALPEFVVGSSACPDLSSVARESMRLAPLQQRAVFGSGVRVQVDDFGERYRVSISGPGISASKTYVDPGRDCARRTTIAAVLVFMSLLPPQMAGTNSADSDDEASPGGESAGDFPAGTVASSTMATAPASPPHVQPPAVANGAREAPNNAQRPTRIRLALGLGFVAAPPLIHSLAASAFGVSLRSSVGQGPLSPYLGVAYAAPADFNLKSIGGTIQRWPVAAGLEYRSGLGELDVSTELGAVAVLERVRGRDLLLVKSQTIAEYGVRIGVSATLGAQAIAPFLAMSTDIFPSPLAIVAAPRGEVGTTPLVEIWTTLGVRLGL